MIGFSALFLVQLPENFPRRVSFSVFVWVVRQTGHPVLGLHMDGFGVNRELLDTSRSQCEVHFNRGLYVDGFAIEECRFVTPLFNSFNRCGRKNGVTFHNILYSNGPVLLDDYLNFYGALNVVLSCFRRIFRLNFLDHFRRDEGVRSWWLEGEILV